jgi:subtilase family serine protease
MRSAPEVEPLDPSKSLTVSLGMVLRDASGLQAAVDSVSDPRSPSYRKYMTPEQIADTYGATTADYERVLDWARSRHLAIATHRNRFSVEATGKVADLEAALHVRLSYRLRPDGTRFYAPDEEPAVDADLPIEHVGDLENYVLPVHAAQGGGGSGAGGARTGTDFRNAYAPCTTLTGTGQTIGVWGDTGSNGFLQSDVAVYFRQTMLAFPQPLPVIVSGQPALPAAPSLEGTLDVEMVLSMAPSAQVVFFRGTPDHILAAMADRPDILQLSSSFFPPALDPSAMHDVAALALQGQSFFEASGDNGGRTPGYFAGGTALKAQAVTNVGGTALLMSAYDYDSETAWIGSTGTVMSYSGGGGVPMPPYQVAFATPQNATFGMYRNMPDVAAEAANIAIYRTPDPTTGTVHPENVWGTSAAAPLWAGFMALVNEQAYAQGLPSVGFANPALYALAEKPASYAADFHDVTAGSTTTNMKTCSGGVCQPASMPFAATAGYDLATGLGSPACGLLAALARSPRIGDIVWQNTSSTEVSLMAVTNGTPQTMYLGTSDPASSIQGTGDFNGDGLGDLLWQNGTMGEVSLWLMSQATGVSYTTANIGSADSSWSIRGTGDFDGNGTSDILWSQPTTGATALWLMSGGWVVSTPLLPSVQSPWSIAGTGDFNGDGITDILWRQPQTGANAVWLMYQGFPVEDVSLPSLASPFVALGAGDFNGDGTSDILWMDQTSLETAVWQVSNGQVTDVWFPGVAPGSFGALGDLNGDGISDVLWVGPSGNATIWHMAQSVVADTASVPAPASSQTHGILTAGLFP